MVWRANIAQIVLVVILVPLFCLPFRALLAGSDPYNMLIAFQEIDWFKYIAEVIQDAQQGFSAANQKGSFWEVLNKMIYAGMGQSVIGGLCVLLCFNIWEMIPVIKGILPIIPAAFSTLLGCIFLAEQEQGMPIDNIISVLLFVNIGFLIFRNWHDLRQNDLTDFAVLIVKGGLSLLFNTVISNTISVVFCTIAMLWSGRIQGLFPLLLISFMSICAIVLIFIERLFGKSFEN